MSQTVIKAQVLAGGRGKGRFVLNDGESGDLRVTSQLKAKDVGGVVLTKSAEDA